MITRGRGFRRREKMQKKAVALIIASTLFAITIVLVYVLAYNIFEGDHASAILGTVFATLGMLGAIFGSHK